MHVSDRTLQRLGAAFTGATIAVGVATATLSLTRGTSLPAIAPVTWTDILAQGLPTFILAVFGCFIVWRVPRNALGWLLIAGGASFLVEQFFNEYAYLALLRQPEHWPLGQFAAWAAFWFWVPYQWAAPLILLLFPDGRTATPRWRWVVRGLVAYALVIAALWSVSPVPAAAGSPFPNPLGQRFMTGPSQILAFFDLPGVIAAVLLGLISVVQRYRHGDGDLRHQLKWFLYAGALLPAAFAVSFFQSNTFGPQQVSAVGVASTVLTTAGEIAIPAAIAIAIIKYRLYDIDVVISRTLVYGSLAALITGVYVGIAVGIGELVGSGGRPNLGLSILATAIVAVGFQPARERLQRVANRLVYGKRATPYQVLSEFSSHVAGSYAADEVLPRMARVLHEGTGAESSTVWLRGGDALRPAAWWPPDDSSAAKPVALNGAAPAVVDGALTAITGTTRAVEVRHQGELLGALSVTKRRNESLSPVEEKLLDDLGHQAGLVLKNVGLTADLQRRLEELRLSRQRLVSAQDAERRRLERNLHDGAQQHLVALKVKLGLAEMLAARDPEKAKATITQLKADTDEALETLRDLARGIYPPLLAEKGLALALESQARKATLPVSVESDGIGRYPQDVEATVYFCVLEALQNVQKYASATEVLVRLRESGGTLRFEVRDNGDGFDVAHARKGAGLINMADRLDSIEGTLQVTSAAHSGTSVAGSIPVPAPVGGGAVP